VETSTRPREQSVLPTEIDCGLPPCTGHPFRLHHDPCREYRQSVGRAAREYPTLAISIRSRVLRCCCYHRVGGTRFARVPWCGRIIGGSRCNSSSSSSSSSSSRQCVRAGLLKVNQCGSLGGLTDGKSEKSTRQARLVLLSTEQPLQEEALHKSLSLWLAVCRYHCGPVVERAASVCDQECDMNAKLSKVMGIHNLSTTNCSYLASLNSTTGS
jgi:hypothetical protein